MKDLLDLKKKTFNQKKYKQEYNKTHYKQFKVDLKNEEMEELNTLLDKNKLTKSKFLRNAIDNLRHKK